MRSSTKDEASESYVEPTVDPPKPKMKSVEQRLDEIERRLTSITGPFDNTVPPAEE